MSEVKTFLARKWNVEMCKCMLKHWHGPWIWVQWDTAGSQGVNSPSVAEHHQKLKPISLFNIFLRYWAERNEACWTKNTQHPTPTHCVTLPAPLSAHHISQSTLACLLLNTVNKILDDVKILTLCQAALCFNLSLSLRQKTHKLGIRLTIILHCLLLCAASFPQSSLQCFTI